MAFRGDERAVTVQVGAVLLLGFLVIALSTYQVTVVPNQNEGVEFRHNQDVQRDMIQLRGAIQTGATSGGIAPQSVALGTQYPPRTLFINPPSPSGTLRNESLGNLTVANAQAVGNSETRDYWDGGTDRTFETDSLTYDPNYNVYQNPPETVIASTVAYNSFDSGTTLALSEQSVVDGRTLSFVALQGNFQRSQSGAVSVDPEAVSRATRTVAVRNDTGTDPVVLTVPTTLSVSTWEDLLADEIDGSNVTTNGEYVHDVRAGSGDAVEIELERGPTYNLRLAKVGVGTGYDEPGARYVTSVSSPGPSIENDTTSEFVVEVRDPYNNPVSGVDVIGSTTNGNDTLSPSTQTTDEEGRATFTYTAPGNYSVGETVGVDFEIGGNATDYEHVHYGLDIRGAGGAGAGNGGNGDGSTDEINPGDQGSIILIDRSTVSNTGTRDVDITLENTTNAGSTLEIEEARISFYFLGGQQGNPSEPTGADITGPNGGGATVSIGGGFVNFTTGGSGPIELNPKPADSSATTLISLGFNGGNNIVQGEDFYVMTVRVSNGETYTYFVSHPD